MNKNIKSRLLSIGIMTGAVVGAGVFSLPFIFFKNGILNSFFYLIIGALIVSYSLLLYAKVIIKTGINHNFVGYSSHYFGDLGYWLAILMSVAQMILVLVVYLIISQSFFKLILGETSILSLLFFWLVGSSVIFLNLKKMAGIESLIIGWIAIIVLLLFFVALPKLLFIDFNNHYLSFSGFLATIGPILFALSGRSAVVEVVRYSKKPSDARRSVILGTIFPAVIYTLFILSAIALSGKSISQDTVSGLIGILSPNLLVIIGLFGLLSIFSAYISTGFDTNDILKVDLRWPFIVRFLFISGAPLVLYILGLKNFLSLVSFIGSFFGPLTFIFIILMWQRITKKWTLEITCLLLIFLIILFGSIFGLYK